MAKEIGGYALINPDGEFNGLAKFSEAQAWEQKVAEKAYSASPLPVIEALLKLQKEGWRVAIVRQILEEQPPEPKGKI